ncbi:MAG TPA: CHAD domain-containing protein [Schlesneria sp.]
MTKPHLARFPKRTLQRVLKKLRGLLKELRPADSEIVEVTHQLRVASRRADVALRLFRDWIPRHRRQHLKSTLKQIRVDAGTVRDLDLLELHWHPDNGDSASEFSPEASAWLHARILDHRSVAFDQLLRWTRQPRQKRFRKQSQQVLDQFKQCGRRRFLKHLPLAISKLANAFREAAPTTVQSLADSHRTRICARRLRYGVELLQAVIPDSTTQLVSSLEAIQQQLGQINDDATANRFVRQSLAGSVAPNIAASLQSWLDRSEAAAMNRLAELSIQMPSPTQSLRRFLGQSD